MISRRGVQEAQDSHVLVVAAVEDDVADDVPVLGGGVAPEHGGGVGPLDGEGSPRAALGEAARPVVVAEYPAGIGESIRGARASIWQLFMVIADGI